MQEQLDPCWLIPLLQAKFYSLCESHDSRNTFFCLDCMGLVLCERCSKSENHHGHQILQVYKASHQVVIKIGDLHKLIDITGIQPYINNDTKVVYINQRRKKEQPTNSNSVAKCETCGWQLLSGSTSKFCSIECKNKSEEKRREELEPYEIKCEIMSLEHTSDQSVQSYRKRSTSDQSKHSYRKRSRKGIPSRSPLF